VIGCGALAVELVELTRRAGLPAMDLTCLPASLHNRPERIPGAVAARIRRARAEGYDRIFVAYADCGTGGLLDRVLEADGVARLEGAHCYEVYAGRAAFAALADDEPGTFYLTDFLARNFERLVIRGLGLDRHPELLPLYFGNYRRLVFLAQTDDPDLTLLAEAGAARLGLAFERRFAGLGELAPAIAGFATSDRAPHAAVAADAPGPPDAPRSARAVGRNVHTAPYASQARNRSEWSSAGTETSPSDRIVVSQASIGVPTTRQAPVDRRIMPHGHQRTRRVAETGACGPLAHGIMSHTHAGSFHEDERGPRPRRVA
jgi:hypothetical protein